MLIGYPNTKVNMVTKAIRDSYAYRKEHYPEMINRLRDKKLRTSNQTQFLDHPEEYDGPPYLAVVTTLNKQVHTVVVDFIAKGNIHYYHPERLDYDVCGEFLKIVEEYHNSGASKRLPLSIYMAAMNQDKVFNVGYQITPLEVVVSVVGMCPQHWFPNIKVKWRRIVLKTGEITKYTPRNSPKGLVVENDVERIALRADGTPYKKGANWGKAKREEHARHLAEFLQEL